MRIWTHAVWTVKSGHEDAFVEQWRALARRSLAELEAAGQPTLLRDRERRNQFISFGPWPSEEEMLRFRSFLQGPLEEIRPLLEDFQPRALDEVVAGA